ncbi:effector-associated constant component EACC1 [Streptomyces apricus]|uniref:effector-associated constant component EACC1 n=1 Tax=Streptomyces apricus TaxID=1828112 RepID=UPI001CAA87D3
MRILLNIKSQDANDSTSLFRWLNNDPDVYPHCDLRPIPKDSDPGTMGIDAQAVEAIFSGVLNLASLIVAIASWKSSRPANPDVIINVGDRSITLTGSSHEEIARVTSLLALEGNTDSSGQQPQE